MSRGSVVALVTAASLIGDTFLYTVLPVSAARLGVAPFMVGVVLSANRWVRLATNPFAARLYERLPAGLIVLAAIVLSAIATALYFEPALILAVLAGRLLWGLCYSLLRMGSYLAAIDEAVHHPGRAIGLTRGVFGVGYLAGAVYAPLALEALGWRDAILVAAALMLLAGLGPALLSASWRRDVAFGKDLAGVSVWEPRLAFLFVAGAAQLAVGAGVLIIAGGIRIAERFPEGGEIAGVLLPATFVAGAFVLTQRVAQLVWQPVAGRIADRSLEATFVIASLMSVAGLLTLLLPLDATAFVAIAGIVNCGSLAAAIAVELAVARLTSATDRPRVLAAFHSWQDLGSAIGALSAGALVMIGTSFALGVGALALLLTVPAWVVARRADVRAGLEARA